MRGKYLILAIFLLTGGMVFLFSNNALAFTTSPAGEVYTPSDLRITIDDSDIAEIHAMNSGFNYWYFTLLCNTYSWTNGTAPVSFSVKTQILSLPQLPIGDICTPVLSGSPDTEGNGAQSTLHPEKNFTIIERPAPPPADCVCTSKSATSSLDCLTCPVIRQGTNIISQFFINYWGYIIIFSVIVAFLGLIGRIF